MRLTRVLLIILIVGMMGMFMACSKQSCPTYSNSRVPLNKNAVKH